MQHVLGMAIGRVKPPGEKPARLYRWMCSCGAHGDWWRGREGRRVAIDEGRDHYAEGMRAAAREGAP